MSVPPVQALAALAPVRPDEIVSQSLHKAAGGSVSVLAFAEGQELAEHSSSRDVLVVVTDGALDVTLGGQTHALGAGQSLRLPAGAPHSVRAPTDARVLLILLRTDG